DAAGKATVEAAHKSKAAIEEVTRAYIPWGEAAEKAADKAVAAQEKINAAEERGAALKEKEADKERKRLGVDKDGFSANADGSRIVMGSELGSLTGIRNFLKNAGLDDAQAKKVALEYTDGQGNIQYSSNPGQKKYGGDTLSMSLLRAAERITFAKDTPQVGGDTQASNTTHTVNVNMGGQSRSINVNGRQDAESLKSLLRQLESSSGVAS
ncbi:MAG: hypothetical protein Q7T07_12165, partial [Burkholderiaceae bacterium]|nr:hypothetical protein [Burkholderiaceae bacterium]